MIIKRQAFGDLLIGHHDLMQADLVRFDQHHLRFCPVLQDAPSDTPGLIAVDSCSTACGEHSNDFKRRGGWNGSSQRERRTLFERACDLVGSFLKFFFKSRTKLSPCHFNTQQKHQQFTARHNSCLGYLIQQHVRQQRKGRRCLFCLARKSRPAMTKAA